MLAVFLGLNSKGLYRSWGKEKESHCFVFTFSTKREIRHFHVVVVQWRQRNVQKSVMLMQSCCFANQNQLLFCRPRWCRRRRCLNSLLLVNNSQHCWMLYVAFVCTPCCMFLGDVGGSCCANFETGQTFSYVQTDATTPNIVGPKMPTMFGVVCT